MQPMPDAFAPRSDIGLIRSPGLRQLAARRRALAACVVLALGLASGAVGAMTDHHAETLGKPQTGPFSYFPS